ncbi:MAG TPA: hypothetical protein VJJ80_00935 [Patescibacteria group bacterium]|nr:hypothetical protein [Patescibacteria group bacterium]
MSRTVCLYSIAGMLKAAEEYLGLGIEGGVEPDWQTKNVAQRKFIRQYYNPCRAEIDKIPEIEYTASPKASEINEFLRQRGFSISIDFPENPMHFGAAGVLDVLVEWKIKGEKKPIRMGTKVIPDAVRLPKEGVGFVKLLSLSEPIVHLETKSDVHVFMYQHPEHIDGFELLEMASDLTAQCQSTFNYHRDYDGIHFPMVNLQQQVDLSWLLGINIDSLDGVPVDLVQVLQENKLRINEIGARAQSATVGKMVFRGIEMPLPDYIIDQPFLIWFVRAGLSMPFFAAWVSEEDWKEPPDIHKA